jgi:hypothetical protein
VRQKSIGKRKQKQADALAKIATIEQRRIEVI